MKIETAIRNACEVSRRVKSVNGLLATPLCRHQSVRIRRIWVFGSTVKGSQAPNDLDLLIDIECVGEFRTWQQTQIDKRYYRQYGIKCAPESIDCALKWLAKGMKKVSRHTVRREADLDLSPMVLIYPRNDLPRHIAALNA